MYGLLEQKAMPKEMYSMAWPIGGGGKGRKVEVSAKELLLNVHCNSVWIPIGAN